MYTIKPLDWRSYKDENGNDRWHTDTVFGGITVEREQYTGWVWRYCFDEYYDEATHCCDSADDGKQQAEAYYLSRLIPALEPVQ